VEGARYDEPLGTSASASCIGAERTHCKRRDKEVQERWWSSKT